MMTCEMTNEMTNDLRAFLTLWHSPSPHLTVLTSGSTGSPKHIQAEKARMRASAQMTLDFLQLRPGQTALLCLPLQYIAGMMMVVRSQVGQLRLHAVEPSRHPLAHCHTPPHFAAMTPMQVFHSLQVPRQRTLLRGIRHLLIGGGSIAPSIEAQLADFPHAVWSTYGMTETLSHIAMRRLSGTTRSDRYRPLPNVSLHQDDEGCLVIDAPLLSPERLYTNDLVQLNDDGTFIILGRRDNVVCSGGIKLHIEALEKQLLTMLSMPFALTAIPDEELGERLILLYEGGEAPSALLHRCSLILSPYTVPKQAYAVSQIPLTPTGKVARKALRHLAESIATAHPHRK